MLTEDRITEREDTPMFFNPRPLNSWRDCPIMAEMWRYRWDGSEVEIQDNNGVITGYPTWQILEISELEYQEWTRADAGMVVTSKDVTDYIKENIQRKEMSRRIAGRWK